MIVNELRANRKTGGGGALGESSPGLKEAQPPTDVNPTGPVRNLPSIFTEGREIAHRSCQEPNIHSGLGELNHKQSEASDTHHSNPMPKSGKDETWATQEGKQQHSWI